MRDIWYGDKKDINKWIILMNLANDNSIKSILQVAFYSKDDSENLDFSFSDGRTINKSISEKVIEHFKPFRNIESIKHIDNRIEIFKEEFKNNQKDRECYFSKLEKKITTLKNKKLIFLDPDTGLSPKKTNKTHYTKSELKTVWESLNIGDTLAIYQHSYRKSKWIKEIKQKLEDILENDIEYAPSTNNKEMVIFYIEKK